MVSDKQISRITISATCASKIANVQHQELDGDLPWDRLPIVTEISACYCFQCYSCTRLRRNVHLIFIPLQPISTKYLCYRKLSDNLFWLQTVIHGLVDSIWNVLMCIVYTPCSFNQMHVLVGSKAKFTKAPRNHYTIRFCFLRASQNMLIVSWLCCRDAYLPRLSHSFPISTSWAKRKNCSPRNFKSKSFSVFPLCCRNEDAEKKSKQPFGLFARRYLSRDIVCSSVDTVLRCGWKLVSWDIILHRFITRVGCLFDWLTGNGFIHIAQTMLNRNMKTIKKKPYLNNLDVENVKFVLQSPMKFIFGAREISKFYHWLRQTDEETW